ncbi:class I SAM-dependent methyltransferase [Gramella jeungdoensis]|uniref:Class I SAM-dependent methyltransferase n=1 Tax=Gramella jeungdoensis TaxID=708091 RepID=A0ABT0Z162_9FLAO|nr:class I SAM-dependent methyltransferase [Gramella jeungdoensis]MCM8569450.1 class I SAM-dependent methyltransferase [Gramella jeungdoensis]
MSIDKAYDEWSGQYDTNKNRTRDLDEMVTKNILKDIPFSKVLELGCGTGKNTQWLSKHADEILAVDFSEKMLEIAKEKVTDSKVRFQKADIIKDWDWTSVKYDLVTCNLILEHVEELKPVFEKAFSNLEHHSYFFVSELHPFKQYKGTKARFESTNGKIELETYTHHISEFISAANDAGFELEKLNEWFDEDLRETPRLISFLFHKK